MIDQAREHAIKSVLETRGGQSVAPGSVTQDKDGKEIKKTNTGGFAKKEQSVALFKSEEQSSGMSFTFFR